jgi:hypothetical protein
MMRQLAQRGLRAVPIVVDPESFGGRHSAVPVADMMQASNMITYLVRCGDNLSSVLSSGSVRARYHAVS